MRVFHDLNDLPAFHNAVVTIGSFDGVHSGHQKILEKVNHLARNTGGESVVITFHPHPRQIVYPKDQSLKLLTTIDEKIQLFERFGVDNVVVVPFTIEFSQQTADEYIEKFLAGKFHPKFIVIGYDHRFGLNRVGDINYLKWYGTREGYQVAEIPKQEIDDIAVSSTKIRQALEAGKMDVAAKWLNHYFTLSGNVVPGRQLGNRLGYPTANLEIANKHKLIPPDGIYAVFVHHKGQRYRGMLYIGNRPSVEPTGRRSIEVNIFDFDKSIYGDKLKVELVAHLRNDATFDSLDELMVQLGRDREASLPLLEAVEEKLIKEEESRNFPSVAIVILNYNTRDLLATYLPRVLSTDYPRFEVIVADNGSHDGTVKMLMERFPEVRVIRFEQNYGFAGGYNHALQQIDAELYVLLNSDVQVTPGWLKPLVRQLEKDDAIAAVQPKIKDFHERSKFEYAGGAGGFIDYLGYPFCRGRIFSTTEKDQGQYDTPMEVFWATGAALVIRSSLFHQVGGFDPDHFAHLEEIDLCWRLKRAGYRIMAVPSSTVYHIGGGTLQYQSPYKTYLNFRNSMYTLFKNEPTGKLLWLIPVRFLLDWLAGVLFIFQGKFRHLVAILKAHWSFYGAIGPLRRKRREYTDLISRISISPEPNLQGVYPRSIVWQYFFWNRKHYKNLG